MKKRKQVKGFEVKYEDGNLIVSGKDFFVLIDSMGRVDLVGNLKGEVEFPGLKWEIAKFLDNIFWLRSGGMATWFQYNGGEFADFEIGGKKHLYGTLPYKIGYKGIVEIREDECGIYFLEGEIYEKLDKKEATELIFKILKDNKIVFLGDKLEYKVSDEKLSILDAGGNPILVIEPGRFDCYYKFVGSNFADTKVILQWFENLISKSYESWRFERYSESVYVGTEQWSFVVDFVNKDNSFFVFSYEMGGVVLEVVVGSEWVKIIGKLNSEVKNISIISKTDLRLFRRYVDSVWGYVEKLWKYLNF